MLTADEVDGYADACDVGQLEACAQQRITDSQDAGPGPSSAAAAAADTRGMPYVSPGGKWNNFKKYSTFRVLPCGPLIACRGLWHTLAGLRNWGCAVFASMFYTDAMCLRRSLSRSAALTMTLTMTDMMLLSVCRGRGRSGRSRWRLRCGMWA